MFIAHVLKYKFVEMSVCIFIYSINISIVCICTRLNVYVHNIRLFFFVVSALLICSYATECPGLEKGLGSSAPGCISLQALGLCWGRLQQCSAPYPEVFSGLANTGKFTGIIIPV